MVMRPITGVIALFYTIKYMHVAQERHLKKVFFFSLTVKCCKRPKRHDQKCSSLAVYICIYAGRSATMLLMCIGRRINNINIQSRSSGFFSGALNQNPILLSRHFRVYQLLSRRLCVCLCVSVCMSVYVYIRFRRLEPMTKAPRQSTIGSRRIKSMKRTLVKWGWTRVLQSKALFSSIYTRQR